MKLVVLEYFHQWIALKNSGYDLLNLKILSINPLLTQQLLKCEGLLVEDIYDSIIRNDWDNLNLWGKEKSIELFEDQTIIDLLKIENGSIAKSLYYETGKWLAWFSRNHEISKNLTDSEAWDSIIIFVDKKESLNCSLDKLDSIQYLLHFLASEKNIALETIECEKIKKSKISIKNFFKKNLTHLIQSTTPIKQKDILFYGRFEHSKDILESLSEKICYLDEEFQLKHFQYCKKEGIPYIVLSKQRKKYRFSYAQEDKIRLHEAIVDSLKKGFDSQDFSWAADRLLSWLIPYIEQAYSQFNALKSLDQRIEAKVMILDEDWQFLKRTAAFYFKNQNKFVYMLSHGIPARNFSISESLPRVNISKIFVQSAFEKEKYEVFGADSKDVIITGLPFYKRIHQYRNDYKAKKEDQPKTVLYCPHAIDREVSRKFGINTTPEITIAHSKALLSACSALDLKLVIKLHYNQDEFPIWKELIDECGRKELVELVDHTKEVHRLIADCDILVATFSSAIIEALMMNKPVLILNFTGAKDVHPYVEKGVAVGAYNREDVEEQLRRVFFDDVLKKELQNNLKSQKDYFCGAFDNQSDLRIIEELTSKIDPS